MIPLGERLGLFEHAQDFIACSIIKYIARVLRLDGTAKVDDGPLVEARLYERAEVLRLLELVEQLEHGLIEEVAQPKCPDVVAQFVFLKPHITQLDDIRLDHAAEKSSILRAGFHAQSEGGQSGRAVADFEAVKVVLEDEAGDLWGVVAIFFIHRIEEVEGVGKHVGGASRRVDELDVLGLCDFEKIRLCFSLDVVGHLRSQFGLRTIQEPKSAQGILHQIANNPMRGEKLGHSRNILGRHRRLAGHDGVFFIRDVKLVEPADDLDIAAILVSQADTEGVDDGVLGKDILGEEEFGGVADFLKEKRHVGVVVVARGHKQQSVSLGLGIRTGNAPGEDILERFGIRHFLPESRIKRAAPGLLENLGHDLMGRGGRDHTGTEGVVAIRIHEAQGGEAVEPCVGDPLDKGLAPFLRQHLLQLANLRLKLAVGGGVWPG